MSIRIMSAVFDNSVNKGSALLTQLAIADFANDNGEAYPSIGTLARKARLSDRQIQRAVRVIVRSGEMLIIPGAGPGGVNLYRVLIGVTGGDKLSPGVTSKASRGDADVTREVTIPASRTLYDPSYNQETTSSHTKLNSDSQTPKRSRKSKTSWPYPEDGAPPDWWTSRANSLGLDPGYEWRQWRGVCLAHDLPYSDWMHASLNRLEREAAKKPKTNGRVASPLPLNLDERRARASAAQ